MLNDEICKLRELLNESITKGSDYKRIYEISTELDQLIAQYYKKEIDIRRKKKIKSNVINKHTKKLLVII